ncbi:hypothetical protein HC766_02595 [Candidatus Gracilibacteria bacterium]|nr:hypothetical protein [Candidatus Gracilibacteria bacterium]
MNYQVCLISSANQQSTNLDQFKVNIEGFTNASDTASLEDKLQFVNNAKDKINTNIEINNNLPNCFKDKYSRYYNNKIQADLNNDTKLFQEYITSLNELSEGLKVTDSPKVQAATDKLLQLANQNPVFITLSNLKLPSKNLQMKSKNKLKP